MTRPEYAIYRGEELLATGTAYELSQRYGVQPKTIKFMATPAFHRRMKNRKKPTGRAKYAVRIEE